MAHQMIEIAVVILTCDQRDTTLRCLSSFDGVDRDDVGILVWDNGSTDGTKAAIESQFPGVEVRHSDQNLGVAGGRNAGASAAVELWDPEFLLFLDNDTVVSPDFIQNLRAPFQEISGVGITTPKILSLEDPKRIDAAGGCHVHFYLGETPPVGHGEIDEGQYDVVRDCIAGGIILVRSAVFDAMDGYDTAFNPYGPEDIDFSLRVRKAGYRCLYVPDAVIYHEETQTFEGGEYSRKYARQKAKNWYRLVQKHADPLEKAAFWLVGVPFRLLSAAIREARAGNAKAITGLLTGGWNMIVERFGK